MGIFDSHSGGVEMGKVRWGGEGRWGQFAHPHPHPHPGVGMGVV